MKVLVCVLTSVERGGWVNPYLAQNLITLSHDSRYAVEIEMMMDYYPVDYARNSCVVMARERKAEWLFMIDNDQSFWPGYNALDVLASAGADKAIFAMATMAPMSLPGHEEVFFMPNIRKPEPKEDGEFLAVGKITTGAMFIHHTVWEKIPGPWFKWCYQEGELHQTDSVGGEDFYFCELARRNGFQVWAHCRVIPHWKTCEVAKLGMFTQALKQMAGEFSGPIPKEIKL